MICGNCQNEVPADKLVCPCFEGRATEELLSLAIARFRKREACLYMTPAPWQHLLPTQHKGLSFCRAKRYKQAPETRAITPAMFEELTQKDCCIACYAKVTLALAAEGARVPGTRETEKVKGDGV